MPDPGTTTPRPNYKNVHGTLVDLKPAALARLLILLKLMSEVQCKQMRGPEAWDPLDRDTLWAASYLFLGHVIPPWVHARLLSTIAVLITDLENGSTGAMKWVTISPSTVPHVLRHLRYWAEPLDKLYSTQNIRDIVAIAVGHTRERRRMNGLAESDYFDGPPPPCCQRDIEIFNRATIVPPPAEFVTRHEPGLHQVLSSCKAPRYEKIIDLKQYIDAKWKTNMTLLDMDWEAKEFRNRDVPFPDEESPWHTISRLTPTDRVPLDMMSSTMFNIDKNSPMPGIDGIIGMMSFYLQMVVQALNHLRRTSDVRLEMVAGEMTDVMERMQLGCMGALRDTRGSSDFPTTFDRIHLSNIP